MNREIKFRAWDESQKYMAYQGTPDLETIQSFMHHFGDKTLMQFTGLKDKNSVDIYESDLYYDSYDNLCVVTFNDGCFCVKMIHDSDYSNYLINEIENEDCTDIIGNIYSNPELIK